MSDEDVYHLWEVTTMEALQQQLTSARLDCSRIPERRYMRGTNRMLRGDGGLTDTHLGCGIRDLSSIPMLS